MRLAAVYACVRVLTEAMAQLPLCLYTARSDGGKDRVTDHWLYRLLCRRPNRFQNAFEFREMLQGHLALRGNAYCQIIANNRGEITELIPMHPDRIRIELLESGNYRYRFLNRQGSEIVFARTDVWHLRGLSSDGIIGLSPVELARDSLGMALAAQDYGGRFFANDAKPTGGWIEFPGSFKDTEARKVFRESYQSAQSGANRGKVLVLEQGMKFHEVEDATAFLQSRVDDYYGAFVAAVAKGRGVGVASVRDGMGQGRVLGADAALAQRMVDGIATMPEVIRKMQRAGKPAVSKLNQARNAMACW